MDFKDVNKVLFENSIIPSRNRKRPEYARYITIHTTANKNPGADARTHANYVNNGGGSVGVSWYITVDATRIAQYLPMNENGLHAREGNGAGDISVFGIL